MALWFPLQFKDMHYRLISISELSPVCEIVPCDGLVFPKSPGIDCIYPVTLYKIKIDGGII